MKFIRKEKLKGISIFGFNIEDRETMNMKEVEAKYPWIPRLCSMSFDGYFELEVDEVIKFREHLPPISVKMGEQIGYYFGNTHIIYGGFKRLSNINPFHSFVRELEPLANHPDLIKLLDQELETLL